MNPATLSLIISLVEEAIKVEPSVQAALTSIFTKANPTPADWEALHAAVLANDYSSYVPDSGLPKS
jgi:hypothetical protein